jgi:heme/copper-type cytochrome/quinol oxidase subunit 2
MKTNILKGLAWTFIFGFSLSLSLASAAMPGDANTGRPRVIEIVADKDNTFKVPGQSKAVITLKPEEKIILRITSHFGGEKARDNSVHSLVVKKLRDQGWDIRLKEGTEDFPLVAPGTPGEYVAECTVKCGRGHDDMNMKIVVKN